MLHPQVEGVELTMYKIVVYDCNCCPICDGTVCFFAEEIEDFQRRWFGTGRVPEELKERFLRSKRGELVTDWYDGSDPKLNIVQQDAETLYGEKTVVLDHVTFQAHNAYDCPSLFHVNRWTIRFQWIRFQETYYRIASYQAGGVCSYNRFVKRWESVSCYGNPVLENTVKYEPRCDGGVDRSEWDEPDFDAFEENRIETICWLTNGVFAGEEELKADISSFQVTEEIMDRLFADVVGDAG